MESSLLSRWNVPRTKATLKKHLCKKKLNSVKQEKTEISNDHRLKTTYDLLVPTCGWHSPLHTVCKVKVQKNHRFRSAKAQAKREEGQAAYEHHRSQSHGWYPHYGDRNTISRRSEVPGSVTISICTTTPRKRTQPGAFHFLPATETMGFKYCTRQQQSQTTAATGAFVPEPPAPSASSAGPCEHPRPPVKAPPFADAK